MKRMRHRKSGPARRQRGISLIEVLVAVLIMGIGLLGIAAMQATALRNSQSALERSQSVIQTYAIFDAMRANRTAALGGQYNTGGFECAPPSGTTLAQSDRSAWLGALKQTMGTDTDTTTCGSINCAAGICTVVVRWDDSRGSSTGDGTDGTQRQTATVARL